MVKKKSKDYTETIISLLIIPMTIFCLYIGFWQGLFLMLISMMIGNSPEEENNGNPYDKLNNIQKISVMFFASFWIATGLKAILIIIGLFTSMFSGGSTYSYEDCVKLGIFRGIDSGSILKNCEAYK